jgi:hypothetical protein
MGGGGALWQGGRPLGSCGLAGRGRIVNLCGDRGAFLASWNH